MVKFFLYRILIFSAIASFLMLLESQAIAAGELAQTFTLDGELMIAGTTTALSDPAAVVKIDILDSTKTCILYEEQQTVNTSSSDGYFSIQVGSVTGASKRTSSDPGLTMVQIFQNTTAVTATSASGSTCASNTYTPTSDAARYFRITVTPSSTNVADILSPDTTIDAAPMAMVAQTLQGYSASDFLTTAGLPTCGGGTFLTYNGTNLTCAGVTGASGGTVTSITAGTGLTGSTITTSGTIALAASGVTAGTYGSSSAVPVVTVDGFGRVTNVTTASMSGSPTGSASGDLSGTYPGPIVNGLNGTALSISSLTSGQYLQYNGTNWINSTLSVSDSQITYASEAANTFFAAPNGSVGTPTFRTMVAADLPTVPYTRGGTGLTATPANGQIPIGNGSGYTLGTLTAGSGVTITNTAGVVTITASGSGGTFTSVTGTSPISVATGTSTPVVSISQATTSTDGYLSSTDWNTFNSKMSSSLASGYIFVGNASGTAAAVALSGDATLSSTGALTLASVATFGTYEKVVVNAKGLVTSGSSLASTDITTALGYTPVNKAGDAMTGNLTFASGKASVYTDSGSNTVTVEAPTTISSSYVLKLPTAVAAAAGQVLTSDTSGNLSWSTPSTVATSYSGILPIANGGTNSSTALTGNQVMVSSSGKIVEAGAMTNGQLMIGSTGAAPTAATLTAGAGITITNAANSITIAASGNSMPALPSGDIFVGNSSNGAAAVAMSGDVTITSAGATTVSKIQGTSVSATSPTSSGQVLRYNGSAWTPNFVSMADLRSTITGATALTACGSSQTLTWTAVADNLTCANIAISDSQITYSSEAANTFLAAPNGSVGPPTYRTISSADLPSGILTGSGTANYVPYYSTATTLTNSPIYIHSSYVGIGTTAPSYSLDIGSNTDGLRLPVGNTSQEPTGSAGVLRYNSDTTALEYYDGSSWTPLRSKFNSTSFTASTTLTEASGYQVLNFAPTSSSPTVSLPSTTSLPAGWWVDIINNSSTRNVIVTPSDSSLIDGLSTFQVPRNNDWIRFLWSGSSWHEIFIFGNSFYGPANHTFTLYAGTATTGAGSGINLSATNAYEGAGGAITVSAGAGNSQSSSTYAGGAITMTAGYGVNNGAGGAITLQGGQSNNGGGGTGGGGTVTLQGGLGASIAAVLLNPTGGSVGIGTSSPVSQLHIGSAPTASANYGLLSLGSGPFDGATSGYFVGNSSGTMVAANAASGYAGDLVNLQIAGVSKFRVDASGDIITAGTTTSSGNTSSTGNYTTTGNISTTGTGTITSAGSITDSSATASTSATTGALTVAGGAGISGALYTGSTITSTGNITSGADFLAAFSTAAAPSYAYTGDTTTGEFAPSAGTWAVSTGGTEKMRVNSSGNVGIGTTSPSYLLDVKGTARTQNSFIVSKSASSQTNYITIINASDTGSWQLGMAANSDNMALNSLNGGGTVQTWNLNTGNTTLGANLTVAGTGNSSFAGSVGIGTTAPAAVLDVFGTPSTSGAGSFARLGPSDLGDAFAIGNFTSTSGRVSPGIVGQSNHSTYAGLNLVGRGVDSANQNSIVTFLAGVGSGDLVSGSVAATSSAPAYEFYNGSNLIMTMFASGNVGLGAYNFTNGPWPGSYNLGFAGTSARSIGVERSQTGSLIAGNNLVINAGGASAGGSNLSGGNLVLASGISTGSGTSQIQFNVSPGTASSTTDNTAITAMTISGAGYVGVGTTNPSQLLTAYSNTSSTTPWILSENTASAGGSGFLVQNDGGKYAVMEFNGSGVASYGGANSFNIINQYGSNYIYFDSVSGGAGAVVMGTAGGSLTLQTTGNATLTGTLTQSSDQRLKKDIEPIKGALDSISKMEGVTYKWKDQSKDPGQQIGLIAQEVEKVFPQAVQTDNKGFKSVAYQNLVAPLINAMKEFYKKWQSDSSAKDREIASLKQRADKAEKDSTEKSKELSAIKAYLCAKDPTASICH